MATTPCPDCKTPMSWSSVNNQWYCPRCEIFHQAGPSQGRTAADHLRDELKDIFDSGKRQGQQVYYCPDCKTPLNWIAQYQRWYCFQCKLYK